ncbi:MAG: Gfo/Idh/MocA family oxidoreductase, partial [Caldilineaceae bacterium]|nr:Gfo/Idh/MocA family oxidoreductase [Caldilineaceae bacterium]
MNSKKVKIGIIGAGKIVSFFHLPILSSIEDAQIAYLADVRDPRILARAHRTQAVTIGSSLEALPHCDIALLAIPVAVREPYIFEFAKRGTYIFTEKPFAPTVELHKFWLSMTNHITCNYHRVLYDSISQIKRLMQSKILGKLREVKICEGGIIGKTGKGKESYQNNLELSGGGIVIEWGCHTFSQLAYLFDQHSPTIIDASAEYQDGFDVDLHAEWQLRCDAEVFSLSYDLSVVRPLETRSDFIFDNARVSFDHTRADAYLRIYENSSDERDSSRFLLQL